MSLYWTKNALIHRKMCSTYVTSSQLRPKYESYKILVHTSKGLWWLMNKTRQHLFVQCPVTVSMLCIQFAMPARPILLLTQLQAHLTTSSAWNASLSAMSYCRQQNTKVEYTRLARESLLQDFAYILLWSCREGAYTQLAGAHAELYIHRVHTTGFKWELHTLPGTTPGSHLHTTLFMTPYSTDFAADFLPNRTATPRLSSVYKECRYDAHRNRISMPVYFPKY